MKKTITKTLSVLLAAIMVLSLLPVTEFIPTANAYSGSTYTTNTELAAKLDNVFSGNVNFYTKKVPNYSDDLRVGGYINPSVAYYYGPNSYYKSWTCCAYARMVYYYLFGDVPFYGKPDAYPNSVCLIEGVSKLSYELLKEKGVSCGSYVYVSSKPHHYLILSYNKNTITTLGGNEDEYGRGEIMITTYTWDDFNAKSHRVPVTCIIQPKCSHDNSGYTQKYVCSVCSTVNPAKITSMNNVMYEVVTTDAKSRIAPYKTYSEVNKLQKGTVVTVTGYIENTEKNIWYRLSDGSWIFSEHIKKYECSHSYRGMKIKEATCTEPGSTERTCEKCGYVKIGTIPAKGHQKVSFTGKAATCTESGYTSGTKCSVCNKILSGKETINAKGHSYSSTITKEATCTETGTKKYTCKTCGATKTETIALNEHTKVSFGEKAATCTETGWKAGTKCSVCNKVLIDKTTTPALGHNYKSERTEATCTENERIVYTCTRCNNSYSEDLKNKSDWSLEKPSAGAKNIETKTQYKFREKLHYSGEVADVDGWILYQTDEHVSDWLDWQNSPASSSVLNNYAKYDEQTRYVEGTSKTVYVYFHYCNSRGTYWANCVYESATQYHEITCDSQLTNKVANKYGSGYYYTSSNACPNGCTKWYVGTDYRGSNATRTEKTPGYTQWRYRTYSYIYHYYRWGEWSDWSDTYVAPTSDKEVDTRTMYRYDVEGEKATGHKTVAITEKAATCTENGNTSGTKCSVCNKVLSGNEVIKAKGHSYVTEITKAATCTEAGTKKVTCKNCGVANIETIAATGHKAVAVNEKAATCTENGYTSGTKCSVCNEILSGMTNIPALGHRMVLDKATNELNCEVCGESGGAIGLPEIDVDVQLGDVDEDGKITAADARLALRASVGLENLNEPKTYAADVDKNGNVTAADARLILRYSVGLEKW